MNKNKSNSKFLILCFCLLSTAFFLSCSSSRFEHKFKRRKLKNRGGCDCSPFSFNKNGENPYFNYSVNLQLSETFYIKI